MLNDAQISETRPRMTVTLFPGRSTDALPTGTPGTSPLGSFPISKVALEEHPRTSRWVGLAEAGQILAEAEAYKGAPLTQVELRALMVAHLDAYDPNWSFHRRGISDEWMSGWEYAFALAAQQIARGQDAEPPHGIGIMAHDRFSWPYQSDDSASSKSSPLLEARFRQARVLVHDPQDFFQGVWEGQLAALNNAARPASAAWCFDELLDLLYETGNYGLDFVVGYVLGYGEGLLCGRVWPPARIQRAG